MKLRQLELTNVRRFGGQKAQLGPFGDGLTTITAENEAGKSTFKRLGTYSPILAVPRPWQLL